ncbi:hypothetical protein SEA_GUACAMOLE_33 [Gordonia phage Guacamole]|uniref:hypothetical protein n=1 Tax=Gordonia phage Guacamole TaxID=1821553 RepID=UPI00078BC874|nr:hypothetical protein BJD65_gp33 [Gordonia phage Guacamole]AMS03524.1 hypothetical protein SEA_GUACAMOLE_33 [Gordonia phage Guacamole]QDM56770.1 hypothetical protein SEA_JASPERJR_33 [Gordonia phage JasperJr]
MPTFYTVDRLNLLSQGLVITTQHSGTCTSLLPEQMSVHGHRYLSIDLIAQWCPEDGNGRSAMIELVWELARQQIKPDTPSRLECMFGWRDLDTARTFRGAGEGTIYEVTCDDDSAFKADMNHLDVGGTIMDAATRASAYWMQFPSPRPRWEYLLKLPLTIGPAVD